MNTEQARDLLAEWARQGQEAAPPAWEELPGIPLYMDQVILYLGESLELFQREGSSLLTSSMINNYVKTGLIPHPEKKKYTKEHLAGLMAVCMLKQVLPIQDIKTLFSGGMDPHTYALFRQAHTEGFGGNLPQPGGNLRQRGGLEAGGPPFGGGSQCQAGRGPAHPLPAGGRRAEKVQRERGRKGGHPMKTGVSTACLYPLEPERSLDLLLQLGYRRFEVFPNCMEELSPAYLRDLKSRADAYGAEFVSLHPFTSAMESSLLFGDYPRRTREAFDFYRRYMAAAAYLGAKYVVIHGQPQGHGKLPDEGYWQRFGELYRIGYEEGAFPAQENVRQHRGAAPAFIAGMRQYLGEDCAFVLDVKQCRMAGVEIGDMARAMGPRLLHVHLSDGAPGRPCLLPGAGEMELTPFRRLLEGLGFGGVVVTEVYRDSFSQVKELGNSLSYTKKAFETPIS